jgi:hypothetical protein
MKQKVKSCQVQYKYLIPKQTKFRKEIDLEVTMNKYPALKTRNNVESLCTSNLKR